MTPVKCFGLHNNLTDLCVPSRHYPMPARCRGGVGAAEARCPLLGDAGWDPPALGSYPQIVRGCRRERVRDETVAAGPPRDELGRDVVHIASRASRVEPSRVESKWPQPQPCPSLPLTHLPHLSRATRRSTRGVKLAQHIRVALCSDESDGPRSRNGAHSVKGTIDVNGVLLRRLALIPETE